MTGELPDFQAILVLLRRHSVDFIVVGGVCAVLHGAPVTTFDLDVVPSRRSDNVERLAAALKELGAWYREKPDMRIAPEPQLLGGPGHHLLMTPLGPLDVLGIIGAGDSYEDLSAHARPMTVAPGVSVLVLDLETLIRLKEALGRDKDRAMLPLLRRTLEEQNKGG